MVLPKLIIQDNAQRDAGMVWHFLHHPQSPQYARYIFKSHPEVKAFVDNKDKVQAWVVQWHQKHESEFSQFIYEQELLINDIGARAFTILGSFMDFAWEPDTIYTANLSLLPFSPFKGDEFFYSVLDELSGKPKTGRSVLLVAVHEISHFIFFRYLKQSTKSLGWTLGQDALYFLKEALTTAMMNLPEFRELFNTKRHLGNPELHNILIEQSSEHILLVPWMEERLKNLQQSKGIFYEWIIRIIQNFHTVEMEFSERMKLWHAHGPAIQKDPALLLEYRKPIALEI